MFFELSLSFRFCGFRVRFAFVFYLIVTLDSLGWMCLWMVAYVTCIYWCVVFGALVARFASGWCDLVWILTWLL